MISVPAWNVTIEPALTEILAPGETTELTLSVQVPASAIADRTANISVTSTTVIEKSNDTVFDIIHVDQVIDPDEYEVHLSDSQSTNGLPEEIITITHQIMNMGTTK